MNTKRILAITTITTLGAVGLANAQTPTITEAQKGILDQVKSLFQSGKTTEAKTLLEQNGLQNFIGKKGKGQGGMHGKGNMHQNRKAIEDAIIAGNFANFQTVASTSPLAKIDQNTFNLLTPQFIARKAANEQIQNILKAAGIQAPEKKEKSQ